MDLTHITYHYVPSEEQFGLIELHVKPYEQLNQKQMHFIVTIDQSGSMYDMCKDGKTKMQHLLFTIENMLRILHQTRDIPIAITIISFDDTITTVFETQDLQSEDLDRLLALVNQIAPHGSTNIELALDTVYNKIEQIADGINVVHLFLTDGEITMGTNDVAILKQKMHPKCENICFGYGHSHDSALLNELANMKHGQYRFIDAIQNAGLVYGEVLHDVLYKMCLDVKIECTNGTLYNYATNTWQTAVEYDSLSSEQTKTLYVKTSDPTQCSIRVSYTNMDGVSAELHTAANNTRANLINHMYRQETLALLYRGAKYAQNPVVMDNENFDIDDVWNPYDETYVVLQRDLQNMLNKITDYVVLNELNSDLFLKTLMDDLYICMRTLGSNIGQMFSISRQNAQGRQQTYTCSDIGEFDEPIVFDTTLNMYTSRQRPSTNTYLTPYKTRGVLTMMSQLSCTDTEELY